MLKRMEEKDRDKEEWEKKRKATERKLGTKDQMKRAKYVATMGELVSEAQELQRKASLKLAAWDKDPQCNHALFVAACREYLKHFALLYQAEDPKQYSVHLRTFRDYVKNDLP